MRFKTPPSTAAASMRFDSGLDLQSVDLSHEEGQPVTLRVPLLPEGTFEHCLYGKLEWTPERFASMISNFGAQVTGYCPMLNFDHSALNPSAPTAEAAGWFTSLEHEPGKGLFGIVELTDLGEQAIRLKRYRYISSEVANSYARSTGATFTDVITGAALTNLPFHDTMPGLFSNVPTFDAQAFATLEGDMSFDEIRHMLCEAVRAEVRMMPSRHRYIEEVYPEFFIYEECDYSTGMEMESYFRRGYSVSGMAVTLAPDAEEVEEVWVTKARAAFRAARHEALKLGRGSASTDARGGPARGKSMSQAQSKNPFFEWLRETFSREKDITPEQFRAALNSAPAPEAETGNPTPPAAFTTQEFETLRGQVTALTARVTGAEESQKVAEKALSQERAERAVETYITAGKIKPANRAEAVEFAIESPARFKQVYDAAPSVLNLSGRGFRGGNEEPEGVPVSATAKFLRACDQVGGDYLTAAARVEREQPELYVAYVAESSGRGV